MPKRILVIFYALFLTAIQLAQIASNPTDYVQVILQYGGLGVMLLWFMVRVERRMDAQIKSDNRKVNALNINSHSLMTAIAALRNLDGHVSELARRIAEQIEETNRNDNENPSD